MKFGEYIKELRINKQLTLRQCCAELGVDPSNWSKLERGINPAPKDLSILEKWASFFTLSKEEKESFLDQAALSRSEIPEDLASDDAVLAALPAFFRAARGKPLEGEKLTEFIADIRALNSRDQDKKGIGKKEHD